MTVFEYAPETGQILDFINDGIRNLQEGGMDAKYIVVGDTAYTRLIEAMGERFKRKNGNFETYQFLSIVLDPMRTDTVCVLPGPAETSSHIRIQLIPSSSS